MEKPLIYLTRAIPGKALSLLEENFKVEINPEDRPLTRKELLKNVAGKDGVICQLTDRIDAEIFEAAKGIKGFANYAVGYENIDVPAATERKIPVSNTPGVLTDATAEMAWALIFAASRRVVESDNYLRSGKWKCWGPLQFLGGEITGKTLGIIGGGRIGTSVALKSKGFGMKILYVSRHSNDIIDSIPGSEKVMMEELLERSDFITLHTPLTDETYHLIGEKEISLMKRSAYLINTARGPVVDETALVRALSEKRIAGAGLDVYEKEPELAKGLSSLDNVVITPHTGSATTAARSNMGIKAALNITAMIKGEKAPDCLNPEIYGEL